MRQIQINEQEHRKPAPKGTRLTLKPRVVEINSQSVPRVVEIDGHEKIIEIERELGRGSTSIVYEARVIGGTNDNSFMIVKEFYPYPDNGDILDISRETDGTLKVSAIAQRHECYQERKAQFLKSAEKQRALSNNRAIMEVIVHYFGCYECGDSYYILSQIHNGHTLQLRDFQTLNEKLEVAEKIADVIKVLNESNFLFLDLCPQNLLWIQVGDGTKFVKLFDVDSMLDLSKISNIHRNDIYSHDAYESPQMRMLLNSSTYDFEGEKNNFLEISMNIYNLGVLLFEILFERLPNAEELQFNDRGRRKLTEEFNNRYRKSLCGLEDVASDIINILKTALDKERQNRSPIKELLEKLREIIGRIKNAQDIARERKRITDTSRAQILETIGTKTRIIAFDESGRFEGAQPEVCFIGGFTGDFDNADAERKEIEELLCRACDKFNEERLRNVPIKVHYPSSLHGSGCPFYKEADTIRLSQQERNRYYSLENIFKDEYLGKAVLEYLTSKNYQLFAFINIPDYVESHCGQSPVKSNLTDLEQGSNLYERMAILTLYNYVFYSMQHDVEKYQFELPTRTLNSAGDKELYNIYENNKGAVKKNITNTSTYKTAISVMLFDKNKDMRKLETNYCFNVNTTNYYDKKKENTPFLYAADIVCRYIREQMKQIFGIDDDGKIQRSRITSEGLVELHEACKIDTRIYGDCEAMYRTMVDSVKRMDIGKYYAVCYDLEHTDRPYRDFYLRYWVPEVEQYLSALLQTREFSDQFKERVPEYLAYIEMYMGKKGVHYEKGLYIAEHMEKHILALRDYYNQNTALFGIYDIILRGYNHRGSLELTKKYIAKCDDYKNYVEMPQYIAHALRVMQFYFNALDYEEALQFGKVFKKSVNQLKCAYKNFYSISNKKIETINGAGNVARELPVVFAGKVYSSIGQAYAFVNDYKNARKYFDMALTEFGNNGDDYNITLSYCLHLFISHNKRHEYEKGVTEYFGSKDLRKQMDDAFSKSGYYKLFVFVKAYNVFYADDNANRGILSELITRIQSMDKKNRTYHPWELIYKNLYECILKRKGDNLCSSVCRDIREKALTCVSEADYTIKMIQIRTKLLFQQLENKEKFECSCLNNLLSDDELALCEESAAECTLFGKKVNDMTPTELKDWLDERMGCYMYS